MTINKTPRYVIVIFLLSFISGCVSTNTYFPFREVPPVGDITVELKDNILHLSYGEDNHWYQDISGMESKETYSLYYKEFNDGNEITLACPSGMGNEPFTPSFLRQRICHIEVKKDDGTPNRVKSVWLKRNDEHLNTKEGVGHIEEVQEYLKQRYIALYPKKNAQDKKRETEQAKARREANNKRYKRYAMIENPNVIYYNVGYAPILVPNEKEVPSIDDKNSSEGNILRELWNEK